MIASLLSPPAPSRPVLPVAVDALTRIPTKHFRDVAWARTSIEGCLSAIDAAMTGDRPQALKWVSEAVETVDAAANVAVVSAVCDALTAQAFHAESDVARVTRAVSAFEHDVLIHLAACRQRKEQDAMNDADTAELAAGLVRVVQMHDKDTAIHLDATAALARRIAHAMDLPAAQTFTIELAARLHDIGKVAVTKAVLCKPGPLDAHEWQQMRLHAEIGAAVLLDTPKLAHLAPIVRAHHERMDGYGYPDRLRADEIPLEARIIAVADAFHAMTTERCYRRAMLPNEALDVLAENAGPQFDGDVVEATFELFRYAPRSRRAIA